MKRHQDYSYSRITTLVVGFVIILSVGRPLVSGESDEAPAWQWLGPAGGDVRTVAVSPVDFNLVLAGVSTEMTDLSGALYRSTDRGQHWTQVEMFSATYGRNVCDIAFDADGTIWLATFGGILTGSADATQWTRIDDGLLASRHNTLSIAVDPIRPGTVWVGVSDHFGRQPINLIRTVDGGLTWDNLTPPLPEPMRCYSIKIDPNDSDRVFAAFGLGFWAGAVWFTEDGGVTWFKRSAGLPPEAPVNDLHFDGNRLLAAAGCIFAGYQGGVFESYDLGLTWTPLHDSDWPTRSILAIDVDPNDPEHLVVASEGEGVFRSTDGGDSWTFGAGGTEERFVYDIRFAPAGGSILFAGLSSFGVLRSDDGGDSFEVHNQDIRQLNVTSIAVNPVNSNQVACCYFGYNDGGVFTSEDGGTTWTLENSQIRPCVAVRYTADGTLFSLSNNFQGAINRRQPNGTWLSTTPLPDGIDFAWYYDLAINPSDTSVLLYGGLAKLDDYWTAIIWRSVDEGSSWDRVYTEPEGPTRSVRDILFLENAGGPEVLAAYASGSTDRNNGVLRSSDGGVSWTDSSQGIESGGYGASLLQSTDNPATVFLTNGHQDAIEGGLWVSYDFGHTWNRTSYEGPGLIDLVMLRGKPNVLYASQNQRNPGFARVLRSEDWGASFIPIATGLDRVRLPQEIAVNDHSGVALLLATSRGVYRLVLEEPEVRIPPHWATGRWREYGRPNPKP